MRCLCSVCIVMSVPLCLHGVCVMLWCLNCLVVSAVMCSWVDVFCTAASGRHGAGD